MAASPLQCPACRHTIEPQSTWTLCPSCRIPFETEIFPAFFREQTHGQAGEVLLVEGESSCFYHPAKKAVLPCEGCGRFMCALCDCELHGQHFCPACLEAGKTQGKIKSVENRRTLYDTIALALAVLPLVTILFWVFTLITAPMALFISIRYWNAPRSLIHRTKIRFVIAIAASTLQIVGWGIGIFLLLGSLNG